MFFTHFAWKKWKTLSSRVRYRHYRCTKKTLKDKNDSLFFTSFSSFGGGFKGYSRFLPETTLIFNPFFSSFASFLGTSMGTLDFYRKLYFYLTLLSERLETRSSFLLKIGLVPLKVPFQSPKLFRIVWSTRLLWRSICRMDDPDYSNQQEKVDY